MNGMGTQQNSLGLFSAWCITFSVKSYFLEKFRKNLNRQHKPKRDFLHTASMQLRQLI